jgi:aminomethyltransferase
MSENLRRPPLDDVHADAGADFTGFGGWEMPVEFDGIRTEHEAVRNDVGIFDVSHMGEVTVDGPDATRLLNRVVSTDVAGLSPGDAGYGAICRPDGAMLDDTVVYRLPEAGDGEYLFVPNAGNDEAIVEHVESHRAEWGLDATVENRTADYAMFAVQGPDSVALAADAVSNDLRDLGRFSATYVDLAGERALAARTGYTGEDGLEFILPAGAAPDAWAAFEAQPCGLGARDTLRIEAGFLLSGQDFHPEENPRTPYEAGIGFAVDLDTEFLGRDACEAHYEQGTDEEFVGLELVDRGVPRHGYAVETPDGDAVGEVTSGTMSPTLDDGIGLGYVDTDHAEDGERVRVVVRGERKKARIVIPPFVE